MYPQMTEFWADKRAKFERIDAPSYILASYSTGIHTAGSFRAFEEIPHENKWSASSQHYYEADLPLINFEAPSASDARMARLVSTRNDRRLAAVLRFLHERCR